MADWVNSRALSAQEIERLSDAVAGTYVFPVAAGGAVTQDSGGASMTVDVAAILGGFAVINSTKITAAVAAGSVTLDAADATSPRRDAIWLDDTGTLGKTTGTPLTEDTVYDVDDADTYVIVSPQLPDLNSDEILLAEVYVAADVASVTTSDITDKRQDHAPFSRGHSGTIVKTVTETISASTTLQDDDDFTFPVAINSIYIVRLMAVISTGATPDWKFDFSVPANTTGTGVQGVGYLHLTAAGTYTVGTPLLVAGALTAASRIYVDVELYVTDTAGTVTLQWAQNTSDAGDTSVLKNSWMTYERIGTYTA